MLPIIIIIISIIIIIIIIIVNIIVITIIVINSIQFISLSYLLFLLLEPPVTYKTDFASGSYNVHATSLLLFTNYYK